MKYSIRFISLLTLLIAAISMPVSALALDDSCISQRGYFITQERLPSSSA